MKKLPSGGINEETLAQNKNINDQKLEIKNYFITAGIMAGGAIAHWSMGAFDPAVETIWTLREFAFYGRSLAGGYIVLFLFYLIDRLFRKKRSSASAD